MIVHAHMAPRRVALLAASAAVATMAGFAVSLWCTITAHDTVVLDTINDLPVLGFVVVGVIVVAARPGNRIGWWLLAGGVASALGGAGVDLGQHGLAVDPDSVPAVAAVIIVGQMVRAVGWSALTLVVPVLFPDGRVADPRWRWLERGTWTVLVAAVLDPLLDPTSDMQGVGHWHNPAAPPGAWQAINVPVFLCHIPLTVVLTVAAVVQLVKRWRRGDEHQRQQLLLFACAAALPIVTAPLAIYVGGGGWIFGITAAPLPAAIGFAILARGLYDVRTAANRGLLWLTLSILVAALFALVIGVAGRLGVSSGTPWLPWLAAGIVAAGFAPVRDVLQRGVNRITYGRWSEPYELLATLGQQLEASADVDRLLAGVVTELESLGLRDVRIIATSDGEDVNATGAEPAEVVVPLSAYGSLVGTFRYRAPKQPLRAQDRQVIDDLAGHLGAVLHARVLMRDLQRARERLVLGREEERRRLRRDLHDGLGPALAGHLLRLDVIATNLPPADATRELVDALRSELRETVGELRRVIEGLRPPALDGLGLAGALEQAATRLVGGGPLVVTIQSDTFPTLPAALEVAAYRIATEALTNVVKHAAATTCRVRLAVTDGALVINVDDDGTGLREPAPTRGHGLHTMRERAEELLGAFSITPRRDGTGASVHASLPVAAGTSVAPDSPEPIATVST